MGIKGDTPFKTPEGAGFTLLYDFNALCSLDEELGIDVTNIGDQLGSLPMLRSVFRVGLAEHHGTMTDIEAGRLIHAVGVQKAVELVAKAMKAAFPDAPDESAEGKAKKGKPGTTAAP